MRTVGCSDLPGLLHIPFYRTAQPLAKLSSGLETEPLPRTTRIKTPPRLTIRLRRVPDNLTLEAGKIGDLIQQVRDGNLETRPDVYQLGAIVALRCQDNSFRTIVDIKKLSRGRTVSPADDFGFPLLDGFVAFPDKSRDDMG